MSDFYNSIRNGCPTFVSNQATDMKKILFMLLTAISVSAYAQIQNETPTMMKMNAGIVTDKLSETKEFYTKILNFGVTFENEFYLLIHTPNRQANLGFLKPNHPTQQPIFQEPFNGKGVFLTIEVENVDDVYREIKSKEVDIQIDIRDEPWGDRHFAILDPNGIGIDLVTYTDPNDE